MIDPFLVSQSGEATTSAHCSYYYDPPISPNSELYRIKHACLQEKWEHVEAETDVLRKRVQEAKKEIAKAEEMRRALCNMLDAKGDKWYKKGLLMKEEDPTFIEYPRFDIRDEATPKKKNRSTKTRSRARNRSSQMTAEQKLEEERAKAKIVSIIDSVFSETAKKTAKMEEEMKNKVANVSKDVVGRDPPPFSHGARHVTVQRGPSTSYAKPPPSKITITRSPRTKPPSRKTINYKVFPQQEENSQPTKEKIMGIIEGIKYSYTPYEKPDREFKKPLLQKTVIRSQRALPSVARRALFKLPGPSTSSA